MADLQRLGEMTTDAEILAQIVSAFKERTPPEHFTNFEHCSECEEHDEVLRSRDPLTLAHRDVGNPGWDPICFITPSGFAYYLPALARIALGSKDDADGCYVPQFLFHLSSDGAANGRVLECTKPERHSVVAVLRHIVDTRAELLDRWSCSDRLFEALRYWEDEKPAF